MPNENIKLLPSVEEEEIRRILDLPNTMRFPTENDIAHLRKRIDCLTPSEVRQFGLDKPLPAPTIPDIEVLGDTKALDVIISIKKPQRAEKVAKKVVVVKKVVKKVAKKAIKGISKKVSKRKAK